MSMFIKYGSRVSPLVNYPYLSSFGVLSSPFPTLRPFFYVTDSDLKIALLPLSLEDFWSISLQFVATVSHSCSMCGTGIRRDKFVHMFLWWPVSASRKSSRKLLGYLDWSIPFCLAFVMGLRPDVSVWNEIPTSNCTRFDVRLFCHIRSISSSRFVRRDRHSLARRIKAISCVF